MKLYRRRARVALALASSWGGAGILSWSAFAHAQAGISDPTRPVVPEPQPLAPVASPPGPVAPAPGAAPAAPQPFVAPSTQTPAPSPTPESPPAPPSQAPSPEAPSAGPSPTQQALPAQPSLPVLPASGSASALPPPSLSPAAPAETAPAPSPASMQPPASTQPVQPPPPAPASQVPDRPSQPGTQRPRIGAIGGVGFPRPLAIEAIVMVGGVLAFGAEYGVMPTVTVDNVQAGLWSLAADARVFPFGGSFFFGLRAGHQHIDASTTINVAPYGSVAEGFSVDSWFLNPRVGFLWTSREGLALGIEAGVQFPFGTDVSSSVSLSLAPSAQSAANALGSAVIPTVDLLRVGLLL